jgi:hypothetical protein
MLQDGIDLNQGLEGGYTAEEILNYLASHFPKLSSKIQSAIAGGYTARDILQYINGVDTKSLKRYKGKPKERVDIPFKDDANKFNPYLQGQKKYEEYQKNNPVNKFVEKLPSNLADIAITAASYYGLSKLAKEIPALLNNPTFKNILSQAQKIAGLNPGEENRRQAEEPTLEGDAQTPQTNTAATAQTQPPQPQAPSQTDSLDSSNPPIQSPIGARVAQNTGIPTETLATQTQAMPKTPEIQPTSQTPTPTAQQTQPPKDTSNLSQIIDNLGIGDKVKELAQSELNHTPEEIAAIIRSPQLNAGKKIKNQVGLSPGSIKKLKKLPHEQLVDAVKSYMDKNNLRPDKTLNNAIGNHTSEIMTKNGDIKEVESQKGPVLKTKDGKYLNENEVSKPPEDLEDAVRYIYDSIPESEKSTAFEGALRINLPGKGDHSFTLVQFWDGKVGWYFDVPENIYNDIVTGKYEPKTQGKTGIGEYKPGVIDSRGAGFSKEIRQNPFYSKANKNITWGYADNTYKAQKMIQPILHKLSKEEYDEEGNLIIKKPRSTKG